MLSPRKLDETTRSARVNIRPDRASTIRATAIIGVVIYHAYTTAFHGSWPEFEAAATHWGAGLRFLTGPLFFGLSGLDQLVTIFFIVSGYFSHRAYQRSRETYPRRSLRVFAKYFLWRRFWRLVPTFWLALLLSYFLDQHNPFAWENLRKLAVNATLLKTLYPGYFFSVNHAHWYVAVQWQLDLLYPVFLYILIKRSLRVAMATAWVAAILVNFVLPHFTSEAFIIFLPFKWWAEWSMGVYLEDRHSAGVRVFRWPRYTVAIAVLAAIIAHVYGLPFVGWLAIRLFLGALFEHCLLSHSARHQWERWLTPIGICSYSLYLVHVPVEKLLASGVKALGLDFNSFLVWVSYTLASFSVSFVLAWLSAKYIEKRSAALGNRIWRRRFLLRHKARRRFAHLRLYPKEA